MHKSNHTFHEASSFLSGWLQCTHLNVASLDNGANCTSSPSANGAACGKAIDGKSGAFAFQSGASSHWIKVDFLQSFLINKLRVKQLGISNVSLEFSDASSEVVRQRICFLSITRVLKLA